MEFIELVVASVNDETSRVRSFSLRLADGGILPIFEAGAHVEVEVAGASGQKLRRSYSLCGDPASQNLWRLAVLNEDASRGGSQAVHRNWELGTQVRCSLPINQFRLTSSPMPPGAQHILVAGGIGITPLLAMAHTLKAGSTEWSLHYAARGRASASFVSELEDIAGRRLHLYFDDGDPARGLDVCALIASAPAGSHVYVCGPRGLNEAVISAAAAASWARERVHHEFFSAPNQVANDVGFTVRLQTSDRCVLVDANESVLDALLRAGIEPLYDCRRGECGLCATTVLRGDIDHRDYVLSDIDREKLHQMCICVSRVRSGELVLEL